MIFSEAITYSISWQETAEMNLAQNISAPIWQQLLLKTVLLEKDWSVLGIFVLHQYKFPTPTPYRILKTIPIKLNIRLFMSSNWIEKWKSTGPDPIWLRDSYYIFDTVRILSRLAGSRNHLLLTITNIPPTRHQFVFQCSPWLTCYWPFYPINMVAVKCLDRSVGHL